MKTNLTQNGGHSYFLLRLCPLPPRLSVPLPFAALNQFVARPFPERLPVNPFTPER